MYSLRPHSFLKALGLHTGSNCGLRKETMGGKKVPSPLCLYEPSLLEKAL